MKSGKNIVFLGMMGSGKTSIGTLFSKKLNLDFFDVDNYIEKDQGMKISLIFKEKGEKFFRELEEKITLNILKKRGVVIALGGGAFMNSKIRKEILINHLSFWLNLDSHRMWGMRRAQPRGHRLTAARRALTTRGRHAIEENSK